MKMKAATVSVYQSVYVFSNNVFASTNLLVVEESFAKGMVCLHDAVFCPVPVKQSFVFNRESSSREKSEGRRRRASNEIRVSPEEMSQTEDTIEIRSVVLRTCRGKRGLIRTSGCVWDRGGRRRSKASAKRRQHLQFRTFLHSLTQQQHNKHTTMH